MVIEEGQNNAKFTIEFIQKLGFVVNFKKSSLVPNNYQKYLDVMIDSRNCTFELTKEKKRKLTELLKIFLLKSNCRIVELKKTAKPQILKKCCQSIGS